MKSTVKGFTVYYNPDDGGIGRRLVYKKGEREPGFQWMIEKEARGVFYDIGANIGWITLLASKKCKFIHCFEPDKRSIKYLIQNCQENKISDRVIVNMNAVSDEDGECFLELNRKPNLNTICADSGMEVMCVTIDSYCHRNPVPGAIKMDIEGGEVKAILGALKTIKEHGPKLFIELHPDRYNMGNNFAYVLDRLVREGYYFKYVENAKDKLDYFKQYKLVKQFSFYPKRKVFTGIPSERAIEMCTKIDDDGKKLVRSIMMERK